MSNLPQGTTLSTISLRLGHPDPTTLLTPEFQTAMQTVFSQPNAYTTLQYGPEQGTRSLIEFLIERTNRVQGLDLQPDQLMIVAGSTHAVDMITRLYARPGGVVLVEAPTYADSLHIFRDHQVDLYGIPMDDNGLIVADLATLLTRLKAAGKSPAFLYTIPNFHNPTGITSSEARRKAVLELARDYGFLVVEDDVYGELSFNGKTPCSYYALAQGEGVLSIGSFSKTLAPGLRLGWLVGSPEAIERCVNCGTTQMGGGATPFTANIVAEYCRQGYLESHLARLRTLYKDRCDVMLSTLDRHMPQAIAWTRPAGGFFIWLTLPAHISAMRVKQEAEARGVLVTVGNGFFIDSTQNDHNLRLAFSFAPTTDFDAAINILAQVIAAESNGPLG
jgi:DNA-binding transcriptional MocR family regulator